MTTPAIPHRPVFRTQEVCEIADVQAYVLKTWEAEFPDLGYARTEGAPRVYRRADVERVLRIKHLLFVEGLTLAWARRQLSTEDPPAGDPVQDADVTALADEVTRQHLRDVRSGLQWILGVFTGEAVPAPGMHAAGRAATPRGRSAKGPAAGGARRSRSKAPARRPDRRTARKKR